MCLQRESRVGIGWETYRKAGCPGAYQGETLGRPSVSERSVVARDN